MNNDLISRSALKKQFEELHLHPDLIELIDNAPTVEPTENSAIQYSLGYQDGFLEGKKMNERPQGEWEDHSEEGYVECPFCKHLTNCEDNIDELHYCWNCGAHLQKGGAE